MTRSLEWHSYGTPPISNPYAAKAPHTIPYKPGPEERLLDQLRQKKNKPLDSKKYGIPEDQVDFAHTIDENVIKFFGWENCAKIIQAYRNRDISTLSNILLEFFKDTQHQEDISVKKFIALLRLITVTINDDPRIIHGTRDYAHHILSLTEDAYDINSWLISLKYAIDAKQDHNWMVRPNQIVEAIQEKIN